MPYPPIRPRANGCPPRSARRRRSSPPWHVLGPAAAFCWLGVVTVEVVRDQIALAPPRPPTPAESAAARPGAEAAWRIVQARLVARVSHPVQQPLPLELGAVWATRAGRICGLVNKWDSGVDNMTPFFTVGLRPVFKREDEKQYFRVWAQCRFDRWVVLHPGSETAGFCGTRLGRPVCARWARRDPWGK